MSTRSIIGTAHDGGFAGRYCHWDGYPTCRGAQLLETYREIALVVEDHHERVEKLKLYAIREHRPGYWSSYLTPSQEAAELAKPKYVTCTYCEGTGVRTDKVGVENGMDQRAECNGCNPRFKVDGFHRVGLMLNPKRTDGYRTDNGDSWATNDNDWGAEWAYLVDDKGITVLSSRYGDDDGKAIGMFGSLGSGDIYWRREGFVPWSASDEDADWQAIENGDLRDIGDERDIDWTEIASHHIQSLAEEEDK